VSAGESSPHAPGSTDEQVAQGDEPDVGRGEREPTEADHELAPAWRREE
jgi:hypothetical protein